MCAQALTIRENFTQIPPILLISLFAYFLFLFHSKKYDEGEDLFPVLLLAFSTLPLALVAFRMKREESKKEKIFLLGFLLSLITAFFLSQTKNYGFSEILVFASSITIYLSLAHTSFYRSWLLPGILSISIIAVGIGYYFYFTHPSPRFFATFINLENSGELWPNGAALFLIMVWPLSLALLKGKLKTLAPLATAFIISALYLTYSRGGWLVFILQSLFLFFTIRPYRWKKRFFTQVALITVLTFLIIQGSNLIRGQTHDITTFEEKITFQHQENITSIRERIEFWKGAITLTLEKPFFGYGPYSFRFAYPHVQTTFLGTSDHAHNILLKIASEEGLIAAIFLLGFFIILARTMIKRIRFLENFNEYEALIISSSLLGAILHNQIDYNLNFIVNILLFFILLASVRSMISFQHLQGEKRSYVALLIAGILIVNGIFEMQLTQFEKKAYQSESANDFQKGEMYFEYYEKTLFPREHFMKRFQTFLAEGNIDLAKIALEKHLILNPIDSEGWERLGEIQRSQGKYRDAFSSFKKALNLNPMNHFWYYWNFIDMARKIGSEDEIDKIKGMTLDLLEKYEFQLKNNIHYTVQTPNREAATNLYELLAVVYPKEASSYRERASYYKALTKSKK